MRHSSPILGALGITLVLAAGCSAPKEVAVVTERPSAPTESQAPSTPSPEPVAETPPPAAAVQPGRFDGGKMWTFDNPPLDYFEEAYGFRPDSTWFNKARLGALRFSTYCSASFVSPGGLVMTNHHCARESVADVSDQDEGLIDKGFYASSLDAERAVKDLYVEQLIAIEDVTARVHAASRVVRGDNEKVQARQDKAEQIEEEKTSAAQAQDSTLRVEVIELYNGGQYAAYTFRRFDDVRLVMAPEKQLGYFGGDADNFTYPRYTLDMSFFRVYGKDGQPLQTEHFFPWSTTGSRVGDPVFVIGNPGSTSRLGTVSALVFERDFTKPQEGEALERRAVILKGYLDALPEGEADDALRNTYFSLTNAIKSGEGELRGLRDPDLIARRAAAEAQLKHDIAAVDSLRQAYGGIFQDLEELQRSKKAVVGRMAAFSFFGTELGSRVLTRALYGYYYDTLKRRSLLPPDELAEIRKEAMGFEDFPAAVERALIALRLEELQQALGAGDPTIKKITGGQPIDSVAARLVAATALLDSTRYAPILDDSYLGSGDASVEIIEALAPLYFTYVGQQQSFDNREELLNGQLAQARFALYGTTVPPDASFSLRIADGFVKGYAYNGTEAPAYTTFYGLFNHYFSYKNVSSDWDLPERWLTPPETFDLSTPLNLVTTSDITGGNSGSPLLNQNLEIVGLIFDGNIESLPNSYLFTDETARAIAVDARGILEALDEIYDADRLVLELTTGRTVATEDEADRTMGSQ